MIQSIHIEQQYQKLKKALKFLYSKFLYRALRNGNSVHIYYITS